MEITLLIPVYNEREMLTILWERIQQIINTCEDVRFTWLFVNDGSKDSTWSIV